MQKTAAQHISKVTTPQKQHSFFGNKKDTAFFAPIIQPKLTIAPVNDPYETEADAMADKVMRMPSTETLQAKPSPINIQRKCDACEAEEKLHRKEDDEPEHLQMKPIAGYTIQRQCAACEEEEAIHRKEDNIAERIRLKPAMGSAIQRQCAACEHEEQEINRKENGPSAVPGVTPAVQQSLRSQGRPLDGGTKRFMESRFGYDFGGVQIHNDSLAHQSSKDIKARAYTHGKHIVFGEGQYQPETYAGKQLLAHELTHVVQQNGNLNRKANNNYDSAANSIVFRKVEPAPASPASIDKAKKCDAKPAEDKKTDEEEDNTQYECAFTSKVKSTFPTPAGTCTEEQKETAAKPPDTDQNNSYCKQLATKKMGDVAMLIKAGIESSNSPDSLQQNSPAGHKLKKRGMVGSHVVDTPEHKKEGVNKKAANQNLISAAPNTLDIVRTEAFLFPKKLFEPSNLLALPAKTNVNRVERFARSTIEERSGKVLDFIDGAQLQVTEIGNQGAIMRQFLKERYTAEQHNQKTTSRLAKRQVITSHTFNENAIKKLYADNVLAITLFSLKKQSDLIADTGLYRQLFDLYNDSYALHAQKNFAEAQLHFLQAGLKYGNAADNQAERLAIRFDYAEDDTPEVQHKVMYEESDGVLDGELTSNRYKARASAARQVGSSYKSSLIEQGQKQSDKVDCGLNAGILAGFDLLTLYTNELDCFLELAVAEINDQFKSSVQACAEVYSALMSTLEEVKEHGLSAIDGQALLNSAILTELYHKETDALDNDIALSQRTIADGAGTVAMNLLEMMENYQEDLLQSSNESDAILNLLKSNFERQWDNAYLQQLKLLNLSANTTTETLMDAQEVLAQTLTDITLKANENNKAVVDGAGSSLSNARRSGASVLKEIGHINEKGITDIYARRRKELVEFNNQADKMLRTEVPEKQRKDFEQQTNCFEDGIYKSLQKDFDKTVCNSAEKAAKQVKARWKFWAKIIVLIALALVGGWAIAAVLAAGLTLAAVALAIVIGAAFGATTKIAENLIDGEKWHKGVATAAIVGGVTAIFAVAGKAVMGLKWIAAARNITKAVITIGIDVSAGVVGDVISGNPITIKGILFGVALGAGMGVGHKAFTFLKGKVKGLRANMVAAPEIAPIREGAPVHEEVAVNEGAGAGHQVEPVVEPVGKNNAKEPALKETNKDLKGPNGETPKPEAFKDLDSDMAKLKERAANPENVKEVTDPTFKDKYDAEIGVGEHKFRRDKETGRWCRFSDPVCNIENPGEVNKSVDEALANKNKVEEIPEEQPVAEEPVTAEKPAPTGRRRRTNAKARENKPSVPPEKPADIKVGKRKPKAPKPEVKPEQPEAYVKPEKDAATEKYEAAQDKALNARNNLRQKRWEYESWATTPIENRKPGWRQQLEVKRDTYESALREQENAEMAAARAEDAYKDAKTPLTEKVRAMSDKQPEYIAIRDRAQGIDKVSNTPTENVTVDHIIAINRIVKKIKIVVKDIKDILKVTNNPKNLIAMDGAANSSKGELLWSEWTNARNYYDQPTIDRMIKLEREIEPQLDELIRKMFSPAGNVVVQ
ncbi:MAG: DUF4157 domain-containing protein [Bacteroidota bacterium]